jgi:hypothetical protein
MIQVPFHNQHAIAIYMHMSGRMIAFPGDKNIATPANLTNDRVLPLAVSFVKTAPWTPSQPKKFPSTAQAASRTSPTASQIRPGPDQQQVQLPIHVLGLGRASALFCSDPGQSCAACSKRKNWGKTQGIFQPSRSDRIGKGRSKTRRADLFATALDRACPGSGPARGAAAALQDLRGPSEFRCPNGVWDSCLNPSRYRPLLHLPIVCAKSAVVESRFFE